MEKALRVVTSNPADALKLSSKGYIEKGRDADIVLLDKNTLGIDTVIALGKIMVAGNKPSVRATFE